MDKLRQAAELKLQATGNGEAPDDADLLRLVHELRVHQLELEMQNEELRETRAALVLSLQRFTDLFDFAPVGYFSLDLNGNILQVNLAGAVLLGENRAKLTGRRFIRFVRRDSQAAFTDLMERLSADAGRSTCEIFLSDEPLGQAQRCVRLDGETQDGGSSYLIAAIDISEQQAAARLSEQALNAAVNLARLRSEFVANLSHEIRTPLNGVLGFAQIGLRSCQDVERSRSAFCQILRSGQQLLGVINDILDFSKIEAGKLNIEQTEVNLVELVQRAVEITHGRADAKHLRLLVELDRSLPKVCLSDPLRIGQILLNLLSNAIKFTEDGSVKLSIAKRGEQLVFKVSDTGIGMDADQLDQLFTPFQQADGSITRKYGGTGLGLAISKRIVELMGGQIKVESQPGHGSTFEVRLPCIASTSEGAITSPVSPSRSALRPLDGLSILVAEDEPVNQAVLEFMLTEDGARVTLANDGPAAVERVASDGAQAYDIVLMDVQMPEMDGYEATRQIVKLAPALPIIGQTAHAMAEEKAKCLAAGMADHIAKPIDHDALVDMVLRLLAK